MSTRISKEENQQTNGSAVLAWLQRCDLALSKPEDGFEPFGIGVAQRDLQTQE